MLKIIKFIVKIFINVIYAIWHLLHKIFPKKIVAPLYLTKEEYQYYVKGKKIFYE